jgi:glycosyltransferase involved in cell wall biosynthesis
MPATILIDMRCQQDPEHAERGIASHARQAICLSREVSAMAREARMIGIIDPALAPPPDAVVSIADEILPNGYVPDLGTDALLLNPAPMTPEPAFIGRLLLDDRIAKAAVVYDFIKLDQPHQYLRDAAARLDYFSALAWLNRYDLFLPISADTAERIGGLLTLGARPCVVTGAGLPSWFDLAAAGPPPASKHIMTVAGDDPRKNVELLIRAHAMSPELQRRNVKLTIAGNCREGRQAEFRALAVLHGGNPELVAAPGLVPREVLLDTYRSAWCVVTPSRAEGFSLPVIEAMAAGVPSIASDIPAHAALIRDPALRFGPDDEAGLRLLLERCVYDPSFRAETVAAQAGVWPEFQARAVAGRIWRALEALAAPRRPALNLGRKRIAMLTPLPPVKSGIADYSAMLARNFDPQVELSLFATEPATGAMPASALAHLSGRFDRVVSVMGNSPVHAMIYDLLMRYGGACICHDARLLGFSLSKFGPAWTAGIAAKELGRPVDPAEVLAWAEDETRRQADFLGELAAAARPLMFHTRRSAALVTARFGRQAVYLPFAVPPAWDSQMIAEPARRAARSRLGVSPGTVMIASFGFIQAAKGIEAAVRALALLAKAGVVCLLYWIGESPHDTVGYQALAEALGVTGQVLFPNRFFDGAQYRDHLLAADYGLQLRRGGSGNISGALSDCIVAGLPTVASRDLADNVDAPSYIRRVADEPDPREIADAFIALIVAGPVRAAWDAERRDYCERRSMTRYARNLCEILEL